MRGTATFRCETAPFCVTRVDARSRSETASFWETGTTSFPGGPKGASGTHETASFHLSGTASFPGVLEALEEDPTAQNDVVLSRGSSSTSGGPETEIFAKKLNLGTLEIFLGFNGPENVPFCGIDSPTLSNPGGGEFLQIRMKNLMRKKLDFVQ
jgi:hypothetical protein